MERTSAGYPASLIIHGVAITLLILASRTVTPSGVVRPHTPLIFTPPDIRAAIRLVNPNAGGSGGDHSLESPSQGRLPHFAPEPLAPPEQVVRAVEAKLLVQPELQGPPLIPSDNHSNVWGDPNLLPGAPSNGKGDGGGIGDRHGRGGIGNGGPGPGYGGGSEPGFQTTIFRTGGGVTNPILVHQVEPEFTDAARKARHQGMVKMNVIVDADGRVHDPRIVSSLGMGLDEKALDAVKEWRFKPGTKDGRPVPVYATIEVLFRLL